MRKAWSWLGLNLGKRAGSVSVIGLALTLLLGLGITQLRFVTTNNSYLNGNDKAQIENQHYESLFGGDPIAVMFTMKPGTTIDNLFTAANIAEFKRVQAELTANPSIFSIVSPLDAAELSQSLSESSSGNPANSLAGQLLLSAEQRDPSPKGKAARLADITALLNGESKIPPSQQVLTNPAWAHFLLHDPSGKVRVASATFLPNDHHAVLIAFVKGGLSIEQESVAAGAVEQIFAHSHFQNVVGGKPLVTGVPALLRTINDYLKGGMLTLGALAAVIMVVILILLFNVRWRLLPFFVVAIGLVWAFGIAGYFGIPLTLGSIAGLPVLLGIGMDYAIQLHSRVEEEVVLDRSAHPMQATARGLGPALLVVTFDAVFAFLALTFAKVPMIRQFGWLLVVGIIAVCVCSIILPLSILGIREYKSPTRGKDFSKGRLSRLVVWLGSVPAKAAVPFAIVSIGVLLLGLSMEGSLKLQTDPLQWIDPHNQTVQDINQLKAGSGSDNALGTLVQTDKPWSDSTVAYVTSLSNQLVHQYPNALFQPAGIVNLVSEFIQVPGASVVPPTGAQVEAVNAVAPVDIQRSGSTDGGRYLSIFFRSKTAVLGQLKPVVDHIQNGVNAPPGITVTPGGIAVVGVGLIDNLNASRSLLTYLALILVGLFLMVRLRSLIRSLLSLIPVMVAVGAVSILAYTLNVQLSPMTAVSGPLVVAVCTEFTSLILLRFVEERSRGIGPTGAMAVTASRTGRAFMVSGLTAVAGVAVLATSSWPLLRGFGIIVGLNVAVALLCALVILPPILIWADADGRQWVSRGLIRRDDDHGRFDDVPPPPGDDHPDGAAQQISSGSEPSPGVTVGSATTASPHVEASPTAGSYPTAGTAGSVATDVAGAAQPQTAQPQTAQPQTAQPQTAQPQAAAPIQATNVNPQASASPATVASSPAPATNGTYAQGAAAPPGSWIELHGRYEAYYLQQGYAPSDARAFATHYATIHWTGGAYASNPSTAMHQAAPAAFPQAQTYPQTQATAPAAAQAAQAAPPTPQAAQAAPPTPQAAQAAPPTPQAAQAAPPTPQAAQAAPQPTADAPRVAPQPLRAPAPQQVSPPPQRTGQRGRSSMTSPSHQATGQPDHVHAPPDTGPRPGGPSGPASPASPASPA